MKARLIFEYNLADGEGRLAEKRYATVNIELPDFICFAGLRTDNKLSSVPTEKCNLIGMERIEKGEGL